MQRLLRCLIRSAFIIYITFSDALSSGYREPIMIAKITSMQWMVTTTQPLRRSWLASPM